MVMMGACDIYMTVRVFVMEARYGFVAAGSTRAWGEYLHAQPETGSAEFVAAHPVCHRVDDVF
jgi:hypothetical protein